MSNKEKSVSYEDTIKKWEQEWEKYSHKDINTLSEKDWIDEYKKAWTNMSTLFQEISEEMDSSRLNSFTNKLKQIPTLDKQPICPLPSIEKQDSVSQSFSESYPQYLEIHTEICKNQNDYIPLIKQMIIYALNIEKKLSWYELWFLRIYSLLNNRVKKQKGSFGKGLSRKSLHKFGSPVVDELMKAISEMDTKMLEKRLKELTSDEERKELMKNVANCIRTAYITNEFEETFKLYESTFEEIPDTNLYIVPKKYIDILINRYSVMNTYYLKHIEFEINPNKNRQILEKFSKNDSIKNLVDILTDYILPYYSGIVKNFYITLKHFTEPLIL